MKLFILFIAILMFSLSAQTQNEKSFVINFNAHNSSSPTLGTISNQHFGFPSFEYQILKKKEIWSFEMAKFLTKKAPTYLFDGQERDLLFTDHFLESMLRVQWQKTLLKNSSNIQPFVGASVSPFASRTKRKSLTSSIYPSSIATVGIKNHLSLGSYYHFGPYFISANALVGIANISVVWEDNVDPFSTYSHEQSRNLDLDLLAQDLLFRIGIGMKL